MFLKILPFILIVPGFLMVFAAKWVVTKYNLDKNVVVDFENEMSEEEIAQYKYNKAVVNFKMLGLLISLPGIITMVIIYR